MGKIIKKPRLKKNNRIIKYRNLNSNGEQIIKDWAIGITIAPREENTYIRSLNSVLNSGFSANDIFLFVEPGVSLDPSFFHLNIIKRPEVYGCWKNWFASAKDLKSLKPHADVYGIFQDDIILCKGVKKYLEKILFPYPNMGVLSIFTPKHYTENHPGWYIRNKGMGLWMAQTFLFSPRSFNNMLNHDVTNTWKGQRNIDNIIGKWAQKSGLLPYYHVPSLAQHIGAYSSIWVKNKGKQNRGRKGAIDFVGENFDVSNHKW